MIVVIPCYNRPAHLAALLHTIERARLADQQRYVFVVDAGAPHEIDEVIGAWPLFPRCVAAVVRRHADDGQPRPAYNVLMAWKIGLAFCGNRSMAMPMDDALSEPIGLLEDDLLVAEDLFEFWHDALALSPKAVGVSACQNQNQQKWALSLEQAQLRHTLPLDSQIYEETSYQSLAVAVRRAVIEEVLAYANDDYFADQAGYVERALADEGLPAGAVSQDALFHRVIRRHELAMIYPRVPRACHVGWYGHNRGEGSREVFDLHAGWSTSLEERRIPIDPGRWHSDAMRILKMSSDQMNELADPRFRDIARCDLIRPRAPLKLV
jgi:glycosyltransferase involved in cell wall biosynthesis